MNNVFTFFSSIGNIGLTTTVLSLADTLSRKTENTIAVLSLNAWDDGTDFIAEPSFTLDQIKSRLTGKMFHSADDFKSKFTPIRNNFFILSGNRDRRSERLYSADEIEYLIIRASETFDVVLIDAGSHLDNAMSAVSVDKSNQLYVVLNQQDKAAKQFEQLYESILIEYPIPKNAINLIMNAYQNRTYLPNAEKISKELQLELLVTLPHVENGWLCEIEQKWSNLTEDKAFAKQIEQLANHFVELAHLQFVEGAEEKKKIFGIF